MNKLLFYPKTIFESIFDDPHFFNEDNNYSERVFRNDKGYVMESYLPGMNKKNLNLEIGDNVLSIVGNYKSENEIMSDMSYTYSKKYKVPIDVDQSQISADIKDGILRIKFPYLEIKKKKKRVVSL